MNGYYKFFIIFFYKFVNCAFVCLDIFGGHLSAWVSLSSLLANPGPYILEFFWENIHGRHFPLS